VVWILNLCSVKNLEKKRRRPLDSRKTETTLRAALVVDSGGWFRRMGPPPGHLAFCGAV